MQTSLGTNSLLTLVPEDRDNPLYINMRIVLVFSLQMPMDQNSMQLSFGERRKGREERREGNKENENIASLLGTSLRHSIINEDHDMCLIIVP